MKVDIRTIREYNYFCTALTNNFFSYLSGSWTSLSIGRSIHWRPSNCRPSHGVYCRITSHQVKIAVIVQYNMKICFILATHIHTHNCSKKAHHVYFCFVSCALSCFQTLLFIKSVPLWVSYVHHLFWPKNFIIDHGNNYQCNGWRV